MGVKITKYHCNLSRLLKKYNDLNSCLNGAKFQIQITLLCINMVDINAK